MYELEKKPLCDCEFQNELMLSFKIFNISKLAETIHHYTLSRESGSLENLASTSLL